MRPARALRTLESTVSVIAPRRTKDMSMQPLTHINGAPAIDNTDGRGVAQAIQRRDRNQR
jgi:hypothetical protein